MPHPLFSPELRVMLADDDTAGLKALCDSVHPATAAEALDELSAADIWKVISQADVRTQAAIFEYLPLAKQIEVVESHREGVARLIEKMSHDDRVDLLRRLPPRVSESLLRLVDEADRKDIATLFKYGETTVGAIMTTDYAWLSPTLTAAEAVDQLRQQAPDRETIYYVYVLDELRKRSDGVAVPRKLLGALSLRDLILAPRFALVRDLMEDELVTLKYTDDQELAGQVLARYDFIAVPVVDDEGGMLGIVTHDDVLDVVQEEATEDIQRQGGVSPLGQRYIDASFFAVWKSRAAWLSLLFLAELGTFTVLAHYQDAIAAVVVLALFVPLCLSVGGNSGSQASTLITRSLALGEITPRQWKRVLQARIDDGARARFNARGHRLRPGNFDPGRHEERAGEGHLPVLGQIAGWNENARGSEEHRPLGGRVHRLRSAGGDGDRPDDREGTESPPADGSGPSHHRRGIGRIPR